MGVFENKFNSKIFSGPLQRHRPNIEVHEEIVSIIDSLKVEACLRILLCSNDSPHIAITQHGGLLMIV